MKLCPSCNNKYPDDGNFCPREECAGEQGPRRLEPIVEEPLTRFVPVSRLGGGQSGEVWQSSDAQSGAAVAYKIVTAEVLPTAAAFERAQRELRQLQRASNPHIVKIIDFGKTTEGRLFVASELASGEPLDQVVTRSGPFGLDRAKRIAAQIGEALLEAQKVGVVHRDLSAKNVLVSGDDQVRVINFAIPRPCANNLFGVPEFMSPEQADGKLIDQRSNTYSLGALLYLMLTGHPPHTGTTPRAIVEAVQKAEITPPSIKRGEGLTTEVDRILLKALERNSSRRPLTMRQFLTDVSGLIVTEAQSASSPTAGAGRDGGFARTMMFAGGATEVQKLVAQAIAARQAVANGASDAVAGAPAGEPLADVPATEVPASPIAAQRTPSPVMPQPQAAEAASPVSPMALTGEMRAGATPAPVARPSHGAAIAATMIAMPATRGAIPGSSAMGNIPGGTPAAHPPASRTVDSSHTPPLGAALVSGSDAAGGNFRETLWFKKGDVDQMVADARAKVAAMAGAKKAAAAADPELPPEDAKPLEDRYVDDGTVTVDDRKKFSLGSGATSTATSRGGKVPGERMSENEMLGEIGGGKRLLIIGVVVALVVVLVAVVFVSMKGGSKGQDQVTDQTRPGENAASDQKNPGLPAAPPQAATEKPAPEKLAPDKPAAEKPVAEKKPAAEAAVEPDEKPQPAAKPSPANAKRKAAKKKPGSKKKK